MKSGINRHESDVLHALNASGTSRTVKTSWPRISTKDGARTNLWAIAQSQRPEPRPGQWTLALTESKLEGQDPAIDTVDDRIERIRMRERKRHHRRHGGLGGTSISGRASVIGGVGTKDGNEGIAKEDPSDTETVELGQAGELLGNSTAASGLRKPRERLWAQSFSPINPACDLASEGMTYQCSLDKGYTTSPVISSYKRDSNDTHHSSCDPSPPENDESFTQSGSLPNDWSEGVDLTSDDTEYHAFTAYFRELAQEISDLSGETYHESGVRISDPLPAIDNLPNGLDEFGPGAPQCRHSGFRLSSSNLTEMT